MRKTIFILVAIALLPLSNAVAQDEFEYVVPAFAYHLAGVGDNLWSSEIYISNPSGVAATVHLNEFLPGRLVVPTPCLPPQGIPREVPPFTTILWPAHDVAFELGCATEVVGALTFVADREVSIVSRMVNEKVEDVPVEEGFIPGFGVEIPGEAMGDATRPGERLMLPALVWHPEACANPTFETSIGFVNVGDSQVDVALNFSGQNKPDYVYINYRPVSDNMEVSVPPHGWRQVTFNPPGEDRSEECGPAEVFDLIADPDGTIFAYAVVTDRSTQDSRIVLPVPIVDDAKGAGW